LIGARPQVFALQYLPETTLLTQRLPLAAASRPKPRKRCNLGARFSPSWQQPRRARPATLRHWRPATLRHWRKVAGTRWPHARAGEAPANAQPGETQVPPPRGRGRCRVRYRTRCAISYTLCDIVHADLGRLRAHLGETSETVTAGNAFAAAPRARGRDFSGRHEKLSWSGGSTRTRARRPGTAAPPARHQRSPGRRATAGACAVAGRSLNVQRTCR
jgi:hypothetical protein